MEVKLIINDEDLKCLEHGVVDIQEQAEDWLAGKLNSCKRNLVDEGFAALRRDPAVTTIPADDAGIISIYTARDDYLNMKQRHDKAKAEAAARKAANN